MMDLLKILLGFAAVAAVLWLYLKLRLFLDEVGRRFFGPSFGLIGIRRAPKVEIQTLFNGNTKDQDQI
jgi:hypothetical protein